MLVLINNGYKHVLHACPYHYKLIDSYLMCCHGYRMTVFTFLEDPSQEETTIQFTGEDPYLQYVSHSHNLLSHGLISHPHRSHDLFSSHLSLISCPLNHNH